jgi:glycosyltransferase involved in cell wall biosynthesis
MILPTHNRFEYLQHSLNSILCQTYPLQRMEFIIVLDGCTDGTLQFVEEVRDKTIPLCANFVVISFDKNRERAEARNAGITEATGKYVFLQEDDDISVCDRVGRQVAYFEGNPSCSILGGPLEFIDKSGIRMSDQYWKPPRGFESGPQLREHMLTGLTVICTPTIAFRREVFDSYQFRSEFIPAEDFDWLIRASREFEIHNLTHKGLVKYRVHENQSNSRVQQINKWLAIELERKLIACS